MALSHQQNQTLPQPTKNPCPVSLFDPKTRARLLPVPWANLETRFSTTSFKARFNGPTCSSSPLHCITTTLLVRPPTVVISARTTLAWTNLITRLKSWFKPGLSSQQIVAFNNFPPSSQKLNVASSHSPGNGHDVSSSGRLLLQQPSRSRRPTSSTCLFSSLT